MDQRDGNGDGGGRVGAAGEADEAREPFEDDDDWTDFDDDPPDDDDPLMNLLERVAEAPAVGVGLTPERLLQADLGVGSVLDDRYELLEVVGKGGFGIIYKARQKGTRQPVAVKVMLPSRLVQSREAEVSIRRFEQEMHLIGTLRHPNVVRLIDSGQLDSGLMYMVLEYIEGDSLAERIASSGALDLADALRLMAQVLEALSAAHHVGIVHRDLKPQNIMVTTVGARPCAKVLDFGVASVVEQTQGADFQTLTLTGQIVGTPYYMAPEQLRGERSLVSDIYSWGLVFIECLSGTRVVQTRTIARAIQWQLDPAPVPIPEALVGSPLGLLLERATAKDAAARYPRVEAVLSDLEALLTDPVAATRQPPGARRHDPPDPTDPPDPPDPTDPARRAPSTTTSPSLSAPPSSSTSLPRPPSAAENRSAASAATWRLVIVVQLAALAIIALLLWLFVR